MSSSLGPGVFFSWAQAFGLPPCAGFCKGSIRVPKGLLQGYSKGYHKLSYKGC